MIFDFWKLKASSNEKIFLQDDFVNGPRILFVGNAMSTHTHAWVDQLTGSNFNLRFFGLPDNEVALPPDHFPLKTYVNDNHFGKATHNRLPIWPNGEHHIKGWRSRIKKPDIQKPNSYDTYLWLKWVIETWKPDIIHTLGVYPAGQILYNIIKEYLPDKSFKWVMQMRGGSDLQLKRFDPNWMHQIKLFIGYVDQIICDNISYIDYLTKEGVSRSLFSNLCPVPGTGGIDVEMLSKWTCKTSDRRIILWPKAYEIDQSKSIPIVEAFRKVWEKLKPFKLILLAAVHMEVRLWLRTMPEEFQNMCEIYNFVPREKALSYMSQARVMLAPSLLDGRPNTMLEAMATGAVPIVSPLDSICEVAEDNVNVVFARNLYIDEIALALERTMSENDLVDKISENNLALIKKIADRQKLKPKIIDFYQSIVHNSMQGN